MKADAFPLTAIRIPCINRIHVVQSCYLDFMSVTAFGIYSGRESRNVYKKALRF